ncbi:hypothetical protein [Marinibacterium profundimaris]|uniref:Ketol-acid reductoisomerase n=1 Tax=Marinibacterium profundimaris TaxID=1679460 RepID=A0A225NWC9_9RHOB|nr:hypothetical protein [Marinibacterium profundimaris]OWU77558.1 ketol-acid reductoisomerase [Marinibacterium profundimaris]
MCLSTQALVMFLNLIGADIVTSEPGRIVVHATTADVHWVARADEADRWCTMGPQIDRLARFDAR